MPLLLPSRVVLRVLGLLLNGADQPLDRLGIAGTVAVDIGCKQALLGLLVVDKVKSRRLPSVAPAE